MSIQVLRTDRGVEYESHAFQKFCELFGIKRQKNAACTPQQNGVSERKNRTIMNMVRSMLVRSKVQKKFCPEATNWSIDILNRIPTIDVSNITPEEAWNGRRPDVNHYKKFRCVCYEDVPYQKWKKLDDKGERYVFLAIQNCSKAYKVYNLTTHKIIVSRDVISLKKSFGTGTEDNLRNIHQQFFMMKKKLTNCLIQNKYKRLIFTSKFKYF